MPDAVEGSPSTTSEPSAPQDSPSIANELISARTERGFSQAHLAEISGVSRSAIKAYESGRNMPGSRELRALCLALKVTPNRLLFGTEAPTFEEGGAARLEAFIRTDPEGRVVLRMRLAFLAELLTGDEAAALHLLVQSIATARHGPEKVRQALFGADMLAGMGRVAMNKSVESAKEGVGVDPQAFAADLEAFMTRQGHTKEPEK